MNQAFGLYKWPSGVTIHGLFEIRFWFVVLARKKQVLISNEACEAGTPHTASDRSIEDAAYVRSTDGLLCTLFH